MQLKVEFKGYLYKVMVSSLPLEFVKKVIRHCMGKNNTAYFMNNCFKGVLYFDDELAAKFAGDMGFSWDDWSGKSGFYRNQGYLYAPNLDTTIYEDEQRIIGLPSTKLDPKYVKYDIEPMLKKIKDDEILILMGSVDKGNEVWTLDEYPGNFDPDKLVVSVDDMEEFYFDDLVISGVEYDGKQLTRDGGESIGRSMIVPVLITKDGEVQELFDIIPESPLPDGILL